MIFTFCDRISGYPITSRIHSQYFRFPFHVVTYFMIINNRDMEKIGPIPVLVPALPRLNFGAVDWSSCPRVGAKTGKKERRICNRQRMFYCDGVGVGGWKKRNSFPWARQSARAAAHVARRRRDGPVGPSDGAII